MVWKRVCTFFFFGFPYSNLHADPDFNWAALKCPIVDIGCGTAATEQSLLSLSTTAHLTFTLFDLPPVIAKTQKVCISMIHFHTQQLKCPFQTLSDLGER